MKTPVSDLFGKSPIKPLQEHMATIAACSEELTPLFVASFNQEWPKVKKCMATISTLESQANDMKREFRLHMPLSLFMPMSRTDLLDLVSMQGSIAITTKTIAEIIVHRKLSAPAVLKDDFFSYLKSALSVTHQAQTAINELDELLETGFKGKEIDRVTNLLHKLDERESTADNNEHSLRKKLQDIETEIPPLEAMFLYKIIDQIAELATNSQRLGNRLQLLIAR